MDRDRACSLTEVKEVKEDVNAFLKSDGEVACKLVDACFEASTPLSVVRYESAEVLEQRGTSSSSGSEEFDLLCFREKIAGYLDIGDETCNEVIEHYHLTAATPKAKVRSAVFALIHIKNDVLMSEKVRQDFYVEEVQWLENLGHIFACCTIGFSYCYCWRRARQTQQELCNYVRDREKRMEAAILATLAAEKKSHRASASSHGSASAISSNVRNSEGFLGTNTTVVSPINADM